MFDIRLREYTPAGVRGRVISTIEINSTDAESATAALTFSTTALVADRMEAPFVVGLEYSNGSTWSRPRNDLYVVLEDAENAADQTDVMTFTAQSYVGWLLSQVIHWWDTDSTDGRTRAYNLTPGKLVRQLLSEGQDPTRGWAPMLTTGFTDTADSLGQAWKPEDQIKMSVDLWRPYSALFQSWIEQGHFEWWAEGTTLMLARLGTGADLTSKVVLGGPAFESAQAKTDFKGTFSTLILIPDKTNPTHTYNAGADKRFGALETTMSMAGVSDAATAVRLAQPVMNENRAKKLELSFDWTPAAGGPAPWVDFTVGDLVIARRKVGKIPQRVVGIQVSKREGVVSARAIVGSKLVGLQAKIAKRVGSVSQGGIIGGTGSGIPYNPGVKRPDPIAPSGLNVTSAAYFDATGTAYASVTATCSTVTTDVLGGTVSIKWYELWAKKNSSGESWTRLATTTEEPPSMTYTGLLAGESWSFRVRAYADENVISAYSPVFSLVLAKDTTPPPIPAPPTGTSRLGQVLITHNGLTATGGAQPVDFSHLNVWMSTVSNGAGSKVGELRGDTFVAPEQTYDQPRWYWVAAEDKSGNKSGPSTRISVVTKSVVPQDITQEVMDSITAIVSEDVTTSIGGGVTWSTIAPVTDDGEGRPVGAMWYRRDVANTIIGMWEWSGSTWLPRVFGPDPIANAAITEAKIATGAVLEAKLADAAVATAKLKDSAVTTVKIANLAVGTAKIADAAILEAKIGDLAVSTAKIADAAIVTAKIGDAAITTAKIGDAEITNAKILNLDAGKINLGYLDAARIDVRTITANKLIIGDFTNMIPNAILDGVASGLPAGWSRGNSDSSLANAVATSALPGTAWRLIGTAVTTSVRSDVFEVAPGAEYAVGIRSQNRLTGSATSPAFMRIVWLTKDRTGVIDQQAQVPFSTTFTDYAFSFTAPANAYHAQVVIIQASSALGGDWHSGDYYVRRKATGQFIVDGTITALKLATNSVETDKLAANAVTVGKVAAGAITTVALDALAVTVEKLAADAVSVDKLAANAITSKHTITGAKFQTTATANRGIEITSAGLSAYNSAGQKTVEMVSSTGDVTITGTIRNRVSGPRVEINSNDTRGLIWFYGAAEGGTIRPASIQSDPNGQSLLLYGGNNNTASPIYTTLQLNERSATVSWLLGRSGFEGAAAYPRIRGDENTNTFWERSTGHRLTLATDGYAEFVGNGAKIFGSLTVTGSKNFAMAHPTKPDVTLTHASTESPYNGVEYWSDGLIEMPAQGFKTVTLPPYFEALTAADHRVAILTAGSADAGLWYEPIVNGKVIVHGTPGALFSWGVKARRVQIVDGRDVLAFPIESTTVAPTAPTEPQQE